MTSKELEALVTLNCTPHLGSIKIRTLIAHFGSALAALQADGREIAALPGFGSKIPDSIKLTCHNQIAKKELELAEKYRATIISYQDPSYPKRLLSIPDFPVLLYAKGAFTPSDTQSIAIVGTRHMSIYGGEMAAKFAFDLAARGITVVSGLARGIDTAAHKGALKKGRTIAVIGSGLADIYPTENIALADEIAKQGILLSEFPMMTPPDRQNFPQRNRIVSGMTMGTLLIEAPQKSGAMITMEKGLSQGRKLFAIPGRADQDNFRGNHALIKTGQAKLVENSDDILNTYEDLFCKTPLPNQKQEGPLLEKEELQFLKALPTQEFSFDEAVRLTQLPVQKVNIFLIGLTIKKYIKEFPGKIYKKN